MTSLEGKPTGKPSGGKGNGKCYVSYAERPADTRCHKCKTLGHFTNKCPQKEVNIMVAATATGGNDDKDDALFHVNATWQQHMVFNTTWELSVNAAVDPRVKVQSDWVLLDNQADISIANPRYLQDVQSCDAVRVNGIGGLSMTVSETGHLESFLECTQVRKQWLTC